MKTGVIIVGVVVVTLALAMYFFSEGEVGERGMYGWLTFPLVLGGVILFVIGAFVHDRKDRHIPPEEPSSPKPYSEWRQH